VQQTEVAQKADALSQIALKFEELRDALEGLQQREPPAMYSHKVELLIELLLKYGQSASGWLQPDAALDRNERCPELLVGLLGKLTVFPHEFKYWRRHFMGVGP
jgi:hypothetical protein